MSTPEKSHTSHTPLFIAHRGNLDGRKPEWENHPDYIHEAISEGFDVEIDAWIINERLYLGHDKPRYEVDCEFLLRKLYRVWVHAKDLDAIGFFTQRAPFNVFCHNDDPRTMTTKGFVWTRSIEEDHAAASSIILHLGKDEVRDYKFAGMCTNYPVYHRKQFEQTLHVAHQ